MPPTAPADDLTDAELRRLLASLNVDHSAAGTRAELDALVKKAIRKVQSLDRPLSAGTAAAGTGSASGAGAEGDEAGEAGEAAARRLDPRRMAAWPAGQTAREAYSGVYTMMELGMQLASTRAPAAPVDLFLEYRRVLACYANVFDQQGPHRSIMQDAAQSQGILIDLMGMRQLAPGVPLLEVRYLYTRREELDRSPAMKRAMTGVSGPTDAQGRGKPMQSCEVEVAEIHFMRRMLELNAARLAPAYVQHCSQAWDMGGGLWKVSFFVPAAPVASDESSTVVLPKCAACGAPGSKRCARCNAALYCSRDCQKAHWPAHKVACRAAAGLAPAQAAAAGGAADSSAAAAVAEERVSVSMIAQEGEDCYVSLMSWQLPASRQQPTREPHDLRQPQPNVYGTERFMIKVQAPLNAPPGQRTLVVYDRRRSFQFQVHERQGDAHTKLLTIIRTQGYMGAKAYFWAVRESPERLSIFVRDLPAQQQPW